MAARYPHGLVWLRRDLRLDDHVAIARAAESCDRVTCAFVLDPQLLRGPRVGAPIVQFFFDALAALREELRTLGSDLALLEGAFSDELGALAHRVGAQAVFYNVDYDPAMVERDNAVTTALKTSGLAIEPSVDHVYSAADDIVQESGKPYTVFTPFRRRWETRFSAEPRAPLASAAAVRARLATREAIGTTREIPRPEDYGHASSDAFPRGGAGEAQRRLADFRVHDLEAYDETRNAPFLDRTSHLSPHLRAGTIGIRMCVQAAFAAGAATKRDATGPSTWLSELIWRDFYQQLLVHHPRIASEPFVEAAKTIPYRDDDAGYRAWCEATTGYPIVDAAMMQLNTHGWMHNRLRMIVASFLTKHLLIDYHAGERYFEQHLADADLAANNGGWQWSSSTGTDAAPYFRVFNPTLQGKTYDPDGSFVRAMLPQLAKVPTRYIHEPQTMPPIVALDAGFEIGRDYPLPIVDHRTARERALAVYSKALSRTTPERK